MKMHYPRHFRAGQLVDDLFLICNVVKQTGAVGGDYFRLTLVNTTGRLDTIAGPPAAAIRVGQIVRVCGCVLIRRKRLVLVASSLHPLAQAGEKQVRLGLLGPTPATRQEMEKWYTFHTKREANACAAHLVPNPRRG